MQTAKPMVWPQPYAKVEYIAIDLSTGQVSHINKDPNYVEKAENPESSNFFWAGGCFGVRLSYQQLPNRLFQKKQNPYMFPIDYGGYILGDFVRSNAATCHKMAVSKMMRIPHPHPSSGEDIASTYFEMIGRPQFNNNLFLRHKVMVLPETKLFHHAYSVCQLTAKWDFNSDNVKRVDVTQPIATVSQYVLEKLESPFVYESKKAVDDATKQLYAQDGTRKIDAFKRRCSWGNQSLGYNVHPDNKPQLHKQRPPEIIYTGWRKIQQPGSHRQLPIGFV